MKDKILAMVAAPLIMYGADAYAQDGVSERFRESDRRDLVEIVEDRAKHQVEDADDLWSRISSWASDAATSVGDWILEERLEGQIEDDLMLSIDRPRVKRYIHENYGAPDMNVEIKKFIKDADGRRLEALTEVTYDIGFQGSKIVRQYSFSIEDGRIKDMARKGDSYAVRFDKKITVPELMSLLDLQLSIEERWDSLKGSYDDPDFSMDYEISSDAFKGVRDYLEPRYRDADDALLIPDDMSHAKVGIVASRRDYFDNPEGDALYHIVELYRNTPEGWIFEDEIYRAKWKEGSLLGTETNKFQKESSFDMLKKDIKDTMWDLFDYMRER